MTCWNKENVDIGKPENAPTLANTSGVSSVKSTDIKIADDGVLNTSLTPIDSTKKAEEQDQCLPVKNELSSPKSILFINSNTATVGEITQFTVRVLDAAESGVEGIQLMVFSNNDSHKLDQLTNDQGEVSFSFYAPLKTNTVTWPVSAAFPGSLVMWTHDVRLLADNASARVVSLTPTPSSVVVCSAVTLTAQVEDRYANPVVDGAAAVRFLSSVNGVALGGTVLTDGNGAAVYKGYTQSMAGTTHPAARVDSSVAVSTEVIFRTDAEF